jgi:hypothetical protein
MHLEYFPIHKFPETALQLGPWQSMADQRLQLIHPVRTPGNHRLKGAALGKTAEEGPAL